MCDIKFMQTYESTQMCDNVVDKYTNVRYNVLVLRGADKYIFVVCTLVLGSLSCLNTAGCFLPPSQPKCFSSWWNLTQGLKTFCCCFLTVEKHQTRQLKPKWLFGAERKGIMENSLYKSNAVQMKVTSFDIIHHLRIIVVITHLCIHI